MGKGSEFAFPQRRTQKSGELVKVLNGTSHQGNANHNHSNTPLHTRQDGEKHKD